MRHRSLLVPVLVFTWWAVRCTAGSVSSVESPSSDAGGAALGSEPASQAGDEAWPSGQAPGEQTPDAKPVTEPSNEAPTKSESSPTAAADDAPPGKTYPGDGTQTMGQACNTENRCAAGFGCDGLDRTASGKCIAEDQAAQACKARGDEWGRWGMLGQRYCMPKLADGDKPCTDKKQCTGRCIVRESGATCQRYEVEFGCYQTMVDGKPTQALCVD